MQGDISEVAIWDDVLTATDVEALYASTCSSYIPKTEPSTYTAATTKLAYTGQPSDGQSITLISTDGTTIEYEFDSGGGITTSASKVGVEIGANADATYTNLINVINGPYGHNQGVANRKITIANNTGDGNNTEGNIIFTQTVKGAVGNTCLLYTSPSPRDRG